jgi:CTP:phosphocholine cytidylyltransferase-like protein
MKAIILAEGLGTRISEETSDKPKPIDTLREKQDLEKRALMNPPIWSVGL